MRRKKKDTGGRKSGIIMSLAFPRDSVRHPSGLGWKQAVLKAIGVVINETNRDGKMTSKVRYYILSRKVNAKEFGQAVKGHLGIENQLHWQLAVSYQEDKCRVRQGHADANLAIIRRLTLNILKANKTEKMGIKNKRLLAG